MKTILSGCLLALLAMASPLHADGSTPAQRQQIDELKKTYPLSTCPISGEKLDGDMGKPVDYLYTAKAADGTETTRLVRFCCASCLRKFKKDPAPALKVLDGAAAKPSASAFGT